MELNNKKIKPVAIWLLIGVAMIIIQVVLGGITRLTGSGLSITRWDIITGSLPPLNETEWNEAFAGYQETEQFKQLNASFTLSDFKYIFFWEWLHRVWARLISIVFIIPFIVFLFQKRFTKDLVNPLIWLFILGAMQGLVGWLMVSTGLHNSKLLYVRHYELSIHFITALLVLVYTFWFALKLLIPQEQKVDNKYLYRFSLLIIGVLFIQLIYGAFMAGLKAGAFAPTWPEINTAIFPATDILFHKTPGYINLFENEIMIQLIHRTIAYVLFLKVVYYTYLLYKEKQGSRLFHQTKWLPIATISLQLILGIFTILHAGAKQDLLWLGVAHQFVAMLFLMVMVWEVYLLKKKII